jgi:hypothetical protein
MSEPVSLSNFYRINFKVNNTGWIVLAVILSLLVVLFLLLWIFAVGGCTVTPDPPFGLFGVEFGVDANAQNNCGPNRNQPCLFAKNNLLDCQTECDTLKSICQAFTFNSTTSTMKIVQPSNTFSSPSSSLFVRQNGMVS